MTALIWLVLWHLHLLCCNVNDITRCQDSGETAPYDLQNVSDSPGSTWSDRNDLSILVARPQRWGKAVRHFSEFVLLRFCHHRPQKGRPLSQALNVLYRTSDFLPFSAWLTFLPHLFVYVSSVHVATHSQMHLYLGNPQLLLTERDCVISN